MSTATALWFDDRETITFRTEDLASSSDDDIYLRSKFGLVSVGTERLVATGKVPSEIKQLMRCPYMKGSFDFPIKYGYNIVAHPLDEPEVIFQTMHPHQDHLILPRDHLRSIPSGIPAKRAVLVSNLETALNAVLDSGVTIGDRVAVVGFGLIGSLIARLVSRFPGVELVVVDIVESKLRLAESLGFTACLPDQLPKEYFDVSFHCSGSGNGLQVSIDAVSFEGRIVETSWYGTKHIAINLGSSFHVNRKQIVSSQVANISSVKRGKWDRDRLIDTVLNELQSDDYDRHLTHTIPFHSLVDLFTSIKEEPYMPGLGYVIEY